MTQIKKVIRWAANKSPPHNRMVMFDLDNTLAVCNLIMTIDYVDNFSVEEIAKYISGTKERFDALVLMFFTLRKNGVACKILSNNGWTDRVASVKGFQFFLKIMRVFDPQMTEDDIIYGNNDKVKVFKENQGLMKTYKRG